MEQFSLRLKKEDLEKIKAIAKENDRSINYVIADIVAKFLKGINKNGIYSRYGKQNRCTNNKTIRKW